MRYSGRLHQIRIRGYGMRRVVLAALAVACAATTPANAIELKTPTLSGSGSLTVDASFKACGSLVFPGTTAFAGELTAVGILQGPGTQFGTVRRTIPVVGIGSWNGCIEGSYFGATVGDGKFALSASTADGDYVNVQQCVVNAGAVRCV